MELGGEYALKKVIKLLLCIFLLLNIFSVKVHADIGPKPSVVIDFKGLEGEDYYVTLLSMTESTGPYSALSFGSGYARYEEGDEGYSIFLKFVKFKDEDGFYFLQFFQNCSESQQFSWRYYPPKEFKILLYFPETDRFIISDESYQRYAFDSYFIAKISSLSENQSNIVLEKSYNYKNEVISMVIRIILTFIVEIGIALLFVFRQRKQITFIILVNIITQISLNLALNIINYRSGQMAFVFFYILLEMAVFLVEGTLYNFYLKKHSEKRISSWKPWIYSLLANAASFALGLKLAQMIPGIF